MMLESDELERLREELQSSDPARKESAVKRMAALVEASAPGLLVEALASDSYEVREQALRLIASMAESGDPVLERVAAAVRGVGPGA